MNTTYDPEHTANSELDRVGQRDRWLQEARQITLNESAILFWIPGTNAE